MHRPYIDLTNRKADFVVKYNFIDPQRLKVIPFQGYRCSFMYEEDMLAGKNEIYEIFPEFRDEHGNTILNDSKSVLKEGVADMWIVRVPEGWEFHKPRLKVGGKCFFTEGLRVVAECEILSINF